MRSSALLTALLAIAPLTASGPARGAIFKCVDAAGSVTYTGRPCHEQNLTERVIGIPGVGRSPNRNRRGTPFAPIPDTAGRDRVDGAVGPPPGGPAAARPLELPPDLLPEREPPQRAQP